MKPFIPHELFEINSNLKFELRPNCLIIDNFYKNFEEIHEVISMMPKEVWKFNENSRNFKDYYDVRPTIFNHHDIRNTYESFFQNVLEQAMKLPLDSSFTHSINDKLKNSVKLMHREFHFNCFKWINPPLDKKLQMQPHRDANKLVAIITIDKINDGGLALYDCDNEEDFKFNISEAQNVICDISRFKINRIIPSKANRLCIVDGNTFHGGYISNHKQYLNDWRMNQVFFINKKNN